ncbi:MAG: hypothetical protein JRI97_11180, partial [Deltaproteobacteria bacterium]|nr:hypothetical protein [Deltaproteobacteria bacterium]
MTQERMMSEFPHHHRSIPDALLQEQYELEKESMALGIQRYEKNLQKAMERGERDTLRPEQRLIQDAVPVMARSIEEWCLTQQNGAARFRQTKNVLSLIDPYDLAYLTLRHCINSVTNPQPLLRVAVQLGKQIERHL